MVLLHGFPEAGRGWLPVMQQLAGGHTVVVPDLRGTGESERPESGYRKVDQAEDMRALLRALDLKGPSVVVGHDIGGMVAYAWAAKYPDEVQALVLVELMVPSLGLEALMDPSKGGMFHFGLFMTPEVPELLLANHEQEFMEWWFKSMTLKPDAIPPNDVATYAKLYTGRDRLRGGLAQYRTLLEDAKDNQKLSQVPLPMPVLAIGGAASTGDKLAKGMEPACETLYSAVAPCGHFVMEEEPAWFLAELGKFLKAISQPATASSLPEWITKHLLASKPTVGSRVAVRGGTSSLGTALPAHRGTKDAEVIWLAGDRYTVMLTGAETAGQLAVFHFLVPPGGGPPPHTHTLEDETYYVLRGKATFTVDGHDIEAAPGEVIYGACGVKHSFTNKLDTDLEMVCVCEPAGIEGFFRAAGKQAPDREARPAPPTKEDIARLTEAAPRFGMILG